MIQNILKDKPTKLFVIFTAFFVANALISECIGGKIFSLENMSSDGTNEEKGNSIGLLMCKEYLQANKGSIEVESIEGKGSAFSFILPAAV